MSGSAGPLASDGWYGKKTAQAVTQLQHNLGLPENGKWDDKTAQAAKDSLVSNPKQSARESEHAMSRFGESTDTNATAATLPQASTLSTNSSGTTR